MSRADDLRAELALAELEDELVRLKDGGDPEELRAVKDQVRAARQAHREAREAKPLETAADIIAAQDHEDAIEEALEG